MNILISGYPDYLIFFGVEDTKPPVERDSFILRPRVGDGEDHMSGSYLSQ